MEHISRNDAWLKGLSRFFTGQPCKYGHISERAVANARCLECHRLKAAARRQNIKPEDRENAREYQRYWYALNIGKERERSREKQKRLPPEKVAERTRRWRAAHPEATAAQGKRRYLSVRERCPAWADPIKMRAFYIEARRLTRETGVQHSVDHIIPLRGENVSGLHVESNLQVLPLKDNQKKGAALSPEMIQTA